MEASFQGWYKAAYNVVPWLDYFWGALLRAYEEFEEKVSVIERGPGARGDRVRGEILKRQGPFSISEIEETMPRHQPGHGEGDSACHKSGSVD